MSNRTMIAMWAALTLYNGYCAWSSSGNTGWFIFSTLLFVYSAYRLSQHVFAETNDE
jgi:hypothetical protein